MGKTFFSAITVFFAFSVFTVGNADAQPRYRYREDDKPVRKVVHVVKKPRYVYGHWVKALPRGGVRVVVKNRHYFFCNGVFYQPVKTGFTVVRAPIGARIKRLPAGYRKIVISGRVYFVLEGVYYLYDRRSQDYYVVEQPVEESAVIQYKDEYIAGEIYSELPPGSIVVTKNGLQYFKYQNVYFLVQSQGNNVVYLALKFE